MEWKIKNKGKIIKLRIVKKCERQKKKNNYRKLKWDKNNKKKEESMKENEREIELKMGSIKGKRERKRKR